MFNRKMDEFQRQFFDLGEDNFRLFFKYMNDKDALPISLVRDEQILAQNKQMHEIATKSKQKSTKAVAKMLEMAV